MDLAVILTSFVSQYPWLAGALFAIGAFRVVFKPFFGVLQAYVAYTPNHADDSVLAKIMDSAIYKGVVWFLDFTASIKLPV
jgi:hypothetical protein